MSGIKSTLTVSNLRLIKSPKWLRRILLRGLTIRIFLFVLALVLSFAVGIEHGASAQSGKPVFWIGTDVTHVFDTQIIRFLRDRADIVVINAPYASENHRYSYPSIVRRFNNLAPDLPILMYTWISRWHKTPRIGTTILEGYASKPLLTMQFDGLGGKIKKVAYATGLQSPEFLLGDVSSPDYRKWVVERVKRYVSSTGVDGIAIDGVFRVQPGLAEKRGPKVAANYAKSMDKLFKTLRHTLPKRIMIYNGLDVWDRRRGRLDHEAMKRQADFLQYSDGMVIEWFGMHPGKNIIVPFAEGIGHYLRVMQKHPENRVIVYGRAPWHYTDYEQDYRWQRYLYCAYLLAAGPNSHFKYHASFQYPPHAGRTGGLDYFSDWDVDLGKALTSFERSGEVYLRRFTRGIVLLVPHDGSPSRYHLEKPFYTPEGNQVEGDLALRPGEGVFLLHGSFKHDKRVELDFNDFELPPEDRNYARILLGADGNRFLRISPVLTDHEWDHDFLIQPERSLRTRPLLSFTVRTRDSGTMVLVRCEVDDQKGRYPFVVLEITTGNSSEVSVRFAPDIPYRMTLAGQNVPYISVAGIIEDGHWHVSNVDVEKHLARNGGYVLHRISHIRVIGKLDIDNIRSDVRKFQ